MPPTVAEVRSYVADWPGWLRWLAGGAAALLLVVGAGKCYGDARADEAAKEARAAAHNEMAETYRAEAQRIADSAFARIGAMRDSLDREREARWAAERERDAALARASAAVAAAGRLSPGQLAATPPEVRRALEQLTASVRDLSAQLDTTRAQLRTANSRLDAALAEVAELQRADSLQRAALAEKDRTIAELRDIKTPRCGVACWAGRAGVVVGAFSAGALVGLAF